MISSLVSEFRGLIGLLINGVLNCTVQYCTEGGEKSCSTSARRTLYFHLQL